MCRGAFISEALGLSTELFITLFMEGENVKHRVYVMHIVAVNMAALLFETDMQ